MILNSDSYFYIGSNHKHCDDYALNGLGNNGYTEFAAVSDGCSGSKYTDCGARILLHSNKYAIWQNFKASQFIDEILKEAPRASEYCNLPEEALNATLFHIVVENDSGLENYKKYTIVAFGDGAIIKIKNDNTIELTYIEYPSGAPLYLNYYTSQEKYKNYENQFGLQRKIYRYTFINNIVTNFKIDIDYDGNGYIESNLCDDYKAILVTSDGISSFIDKNKKPIEISTLVRNLIDFKSYKGEFIQRRMNGFNNLCEKQRWKHTDDFSMAGIHIDHA